MRKCKWGILVMVLCMLFGSITAHAETKTFNFVIKATEYDGGNWLAVKADGEQTAYITPTYIDGSGRIWAAVYNQSGGTQHTMDVSIRPGETYRHSSNYYVPGYAGITYRLMGGDSEWEVTSGYFTVSGRWTP